MVSVIGAMIDLGWRFAAEPGGARWARYSRLSAVGTIGFLLASFIQTDVLGLLERIAIVIATGWVAQVMWRSRREVAAA